MLEISVFQMLIRARTNAAYLIFFRFLKMDHVSEEEIWKNSEPLHGPTPKSLNTHMDLMDFVNFKQADLFSDCAVYCAKDKYSVGSNILHETPIRAHRLVLAAASLELCSVFQEFEQHDEDITIVLAEFEWSHVKSALGALYSKLGGLDIQGVDPGAWSFLDHFQISLEEPSIIEDVFREVTKAEQVVKHMDESDEPIRRSGRKPKKRKRFIDGESEEDKPEVKVEVVKGKSADEDSLGFEDALGIEDLFEQHHGEDHEDTDYLAANENQQPSLVKKRRKGYPPSESRLNWLMDETPQQGSKHEITPTMDRDLVRMQLEAKAEDAPLVVSKSCNPVKMELNPNAKYLREPAHRYVPLPCLTKREECFQILLGVRQVNNLVMGRPLAWTKSGELRYESQMYDTINACQKTYGLSQCHLLTEKNLQRQQDVVQSKGKSLFMDQTYKKFRYKCTRDDLKDIVKKIENCDLSQEPEREGKELDLPSETDWRLYLDYNLNHFDNLLVVGCHSDFVTARQVIVSNLTNKFDIGSLCMRILCHVWCGGLEGSKFPATPAISAAHYEASKTVFQLKDAKKLLASGRELPFKLPEFTCEICGKVLQENPKIGRAHV